MSKAIKLFYLKGGHNFGDILSKNIVEAISENEVTHAKAHKAELCAIGSILNKVVKTRFRRLFFRLFGKMDVWGAGINSPGKQLSSLRLTIHALRGRISQQRFGLSEDACVIGDPALLVSRLFPKEKNGESYILICPHQNDRNAYLWIEKLESLYETVRICDLANDVDSILAEINNAQAVFTSAMHPLIVAHSYHTPVLWVDVGHPTVLGGDYKFLDYYSALSIACQSIKKEDVINSVFSLSDIEKRLENSIVSSDEITRIQKDLLASFPAKYCSAAK